MKSSELIRQDEIAVCELAREAKGKTVKLFNGIEGSIVDADPERGCLWVFPTDGSSDVHAWASQVQVIDGRMVTQAGS